ncbi:MAG: choice-of-anchor tandem repeat GloVer-containing protein, partial [Limisphaerales bacterium]
LQMHGQVLEVLHSFEEIDGASPFANLVEGNDGLFYGTTSEGGVYTNSAGKGFGTIFKITTNGVLTSLVSFDGTNGANPWAALIQAADGDFYGNTRYGGTNGTLFKITSQGQLTVLRELYYGIGTSPRIPLLESEGYFYGSTDSGGNANGIINGPTLFKMTPTGELTTLRVFGGLTNISNCEGLIKASDGHLYGISQSGGTNRQGTAFRMDASGATTRLAHFSTAVTGFSPNSIVDGGDGSIYVTARAGGTYNNGTLVQWTSAGQLNCLLSFNTLTNGNTPNSLVLGRDGNLYGTTRDGGPGKGWGTVFKATRQGVVTTLAVFKFLNGWEPNGVIQGKDGNLYGTTRRGGTHDCGTVFRVVLPTLRSERDGNNIVVSWPTNQTGFTLQFSTNAPLPTDWMIVPDSPALSNGRYVITNTTASGARFFRLHK